MVKHRNVGDIVYKQPNAGFIGVGDMMEIKDDGYDDGCFDCEYTECREWNTLWSVEHENGVAYHVSECQMFDSEEDYLNSLD